MKKHHYHCLHGGLPSFYDLNAPCPMGGIVNDKTHDPAQNIIPHLVISSLLGAGRAARHQIKALTCVQRRWHAVEYV